MEYKVRFFGYITITGNEAVGSAKIVNCKDEKEVLNEIKQNIKNSDKIIIELKKVKGGK